MTRKDYERLARALAVSRAAFSPYTHFQREARAVDAVADTIADTLAADNPRFDRARFLAACGVTA